jgi:hypothetical protein
VFGLVGVKLVVEGRWGGEGKTGVLMVQHRHGTRLCIHPPVGPFCYSNISILTCSLRSQSSIISRAPRPWPPLPGPLPGGTDMNGGDSEHGAQEAWRVKGGAYRTYQGNRHTGGPWVA